MIEIRDLHATVDGKPILKGVNLESKARRNSRDYGSEWRRKIDFSQSLSWTSCLRSDGR